MRVSNWLVAQYLERCRQAGLDTTTLLSGLSISREGLGDKLGTVPWDPWTVLLDRVQESLGGPAGMEGFTAGFLPSLRPMQFVAGLVVDVQSLYLLVASRMGRAGYPGLTVRFASLPDGRIWSEGLIDAENRGSCPFWNATVGTYRGYPRLLGLPDAQVEAEITPRHAVFWISPPQSRTLAARAQHLAAPFGSVLRRLLLGEVPPEQLMAELSVAEEASFVLEEAYAAGQRFALIHDRECLADSVVDWMVQRAGCSHVDLTFLGHPNLRRCSGTAAGTVFSRRLTAAERVVGRLDWTHHDGADPARVDAIVPWVGIAVEGCPMGGANDDLHERLAVVRDRWKLTRRQEQVVELVARGRANKEIAAALGCSSKGVEAHLTVLYRKAGTDCRSGLVARVWEG